MVPSTWRLVAGQKVNVIVVVLGTCLLLTCTQASARTDRAIEERARRHTFALLEQAQDQPGSRAELLPEAWKQIQSALARNSRNALQYGLWLEPLWVYYLLQDDHARAKATLEESPEHLTRAGASPLVISNITGSLSYSLILVGEIARAKEYLRRAIVLATGHKHQELLADLYYNLGDAYRKTGERLVAQRYFEAAYEIDRATGDPTKISISDLKLGSLAREAGQVNEAIQRHERALAAFHELRSYRELVTRIELARDHAALGNFDVAERYAREALADPRALPEQQLDANLLLLKMMNERFAGSPPSEADLVLAEKLVRTNEALIADSRARQGSQLARPTHQLQFAEQAIRHYAAQHDLQRVKAYGDAALRLVRHVSDDLSTTNDDTLAWLTSAQPVVNEYVKALYRLDRAAVLPLLETHYGRDTHALPVRHTGAVGRAFEQQTIELFETYRSAERELLNRTAVLERLHSYTHDVATLQATRNDVKQQQRVRDLARDAYLASYSAVPKTESAPKSAGGRGLLDLHALPSGDVAVRYFVQENVSFGVAITRGAIEYFDLPPRSDLVDMVSKAVAVLQVPGKEASKRHMLRALRDLLPPDFAKRFRQAKRLVVLPDDVVQPVPFAAIDIGESGPSYVPLVQHMEVISTRSAVSYYGKPLDRTDNALTSPYDIVVFADPDIGPVSLASTKPDSAIAPTWAEKLPRLPGARTEAEHIRSMFFDRSIRVYLGTAATSSVLLSPAVRSAKLLHIATHAYVSNSSPDLIGLATTGVGLSLPDLFAERFESRLVVISGCETMRGQDYTGWGARSLADGFLVQGAGSVLGTLWEVSDAATAVFMAHFYRALRSTDGNSSAALKEAQSRMQRSSQFSDPYFWSGFVLQSRSRQMDQRAL